MKYAEFMGKICIIGLLRKLSWSGIMHNQVLELSMPENL